MAKMQNIRLERDGDDLLIRVNMRHDDCLAQSGASVLVASSHNFKQIWLDGEEMPMEMSLNIRRDFESDEPRTVEDGWLRRQDRK